MTKTLPEHIPVGFPHVNLINVTSNIVQIGLTRFYNFLCPPTVPEMTTCLMSIFHFSSMQQSLIFLKHHFVD